MTAVGKSILKEASLCFTEARKRIVHGTELLYQIHEKQLWEGEFSSFSEYVEDECQMSKGYASKLIAMWQFYVIDGKVSPAKLAGVDNEKLYLAIKVPARNMEERLVKAREWSRRDFRIELSSKDGVECAHPEDKRVIICGICHARVG